MNFDESSVPCAVECPSGTSHLSCSPSATKKIKKNKKNKKKETTLAFSALQNHLKMNCPMMDVKCSFATKGCIWKGKLKDRSDHLKSECPYQTVICGYPRDIGDPSNRCKFQILRKDRRKHVKESCGYYRIDCPLKCG